MQIGFRRSFWHKSSFHSVSIFIKNGHVTVRRCRKKGKMNLEVLKPSVFHFESMFSSMFQKCHVSHCSWIWDFQRFIEQVHHFQVHLFRPSYWLNTVQLKNTWFFHVIISRRTWNLFWTFLIWGAGSHLTWPVSCRWRILSPTLSHRNHRHL